MAIGIAEVEAVPVLEGLGRARRKAIASPSCH
jgi:hypothetical protein